jgi:hypothetical protein
LLTFVGARVAAQGAFDYDIRRGFTLLSDAGSASAMTDSRAARIVKAEADARMIVNAIHLFHTTLAASRRRSAS